MADTNTPFQGHPFYVALSIFNVAMRTPLNIAAAFWRPWFTDDENKKVRTAQDAEGQEVEISLPKTEKIAQSAAMPEEISHPTKRKQKAPKPPMKKAAAEKKPKPPTKHTLKESSNWSEKSKPKRRSGCANFDRRKNQPRGGKDHQTTATPGQEVTKRRRVALSR